MADDEYDSSEEFNLVDPTYPAFYEEHVQDACQGFSKFATAQTKYVRSQEMKALMKAYLVDEEKTLIAVSKIEKTPQKIYISGEEFEYEYDGLFEKKVMHVETVYACDFCFTTFPTLNSLANHNEVCTQFTTPGRVIYKDPKYPFEVRECCGLRDRLYVTRLSRVAKCFISTKSLQSDCEPFNYYVLYGLRDDGKRYFIGYFSKQKYNRSEINLCCFMVLPCHRKKGYGRFIIEFSFLLSAVERSPGLPEQPISAPAAQLYHQTVYEIVLEYIFDLCLKSAVRFPYTNRNFSIIQMSIATGIHTRLLRKVLETEKCIRVDEIVDMIDVDMSELINQQSRLKSNNNRRIMVWHEHLNFNLPLDYDIQRKIHMEYDPESRHFVRGSGSNNTFEISKRTTQEEHEEMVEKGFGYSRSYAFTVKDETTEIPQNVSNINAFGKKKKQGRPTRRRR